MSRKIKIGSPSKGASISDSSATPKSVSQQILPRLAAAQKLTANLNAVIAAAKKPKA